MGLEDYEEAVARVDKMKEDQLRKQSFNGLAAIASLFSTANTVWHNVSSESRMAQSISRNKSANAMTTHHPSTGERSAHNRFLRKSNKNR